MKRTLYWDIDGTVLDYSDVVKPLLANGAMQRLCRAAGIDELACVSGWTCLALDHRRFGPPPSHAQQCESIRTLVADAFPDKSEFHQMCVLCADNDFRCRHIDLHTDWYYVDDWAEEFFTKQYGADAYRKYAGTRILTCDPRGDGADVVQWLEHIAATSSDGRFASGRFDGVPRQAGE